MLAVLCLGIALGSGSLQGSDPHRERPRARELGLLVGELPPGPVNAITDVAGVRVGHVTLRQGRRYNTGVTAVLPHAGNLFLEKVSGAVVAGNGFGKLVGSTQVNELGEIETPILLTGTLSVFRVADGLIDHMLSLPGMEEVRSINPLVAETNDGYLSDIRARPLGAREVAAAIAAAREGPVPMGAVGAGAGTVCFGFKGGIGSASRRLEPSQGGWTVGVLAQTNFGGTLRIEGLPARIRGTPLGEFLHRRAPPAGGQKTPDGSLILVLATDAPLDHRNLRRLARRGLYGMARTGGYGSNGSGDYAIAFSTHHEWRIRSSPGVPDPRRPVLENSSMSPLFQAAAEAAEEAIVDSLFTATATVGFRGAAPALPVDEVLALAAAADRRSANQP